MKGVIKPSGAQKGEMKEDQGIREDKRLKDQKRAGNKPSPNQAIPV